MTNLLIGYPQAQTITSNSTFATDHPIETLRTYARGDWAELANAAGGDCTFTYTPGSSQYLYLARATLLQGDGVDYISVSGDSLLFEESSFDTAALIGPNEEDYLATWTADASSSVVVTMSTSITSKYPHSKQLLGTWFDLGRDPVYGYRSSETYPSPGNRFPRRLMPLTWRGLSDSTIQSLDTALGAYYDTLPIVLYDSGDEVFNGYRALFGRIRRLSSAPTSVNNNTLLMEFEELI